MNILYEEHKFRAYFIATLAIIFLISGVALFLVCKIKNINLTSHTSKNQKHLSYNHIS